ncbi:MAG: hypothetical protein EXR77_19810 [Myxococcales bacterium]|nr:hypothetical protein [Myxococcales bacterium]
MNRILILALVAAIVFAALYSTQTPAIGSGPAFVGGKNPRVRIAVDLKIPVVSTDNTNAATAGYQQDLFTIPPDRVGTFALLVTHGPVPNAPLKEAGYPVAATDICVTVDGAPFACGASGGTYFGAFDGTKLYDLGPFPPGSKIGASLKAMNGFGDLSSYPIGSQIKVAVELTGVLYRK